MNKPQIFEIVSKYDTTEKQKAIILNHVGRLIKRSITQAEKDNKFHLLPDLVKLQEVFPYNRAMRKEGNLEVHVQVLAGVNPSVLNGVRFKAEKLGKITASSDTAFTFITVNVKVEAFINTLEDLEGFKVFAPDLQKFLEVSAAQKEDKKSKNA